MTKGIREKSNDTLIVENRLRNTIPGDVVEYAELSKLLGRDARTFCRASLNSARRILVGDSIFFDTLPNIGFKRLTDAEAAFAADHFTRRARSAASSGLRHLRHVPFESLPDDAKQRHLAATAQLGVVKLFASGKAAKKIEQSVNGAAMPIGETLRLFGGS